jgi:hypothetical protein
MTYGKGREGEKQMIRGLEVLKNDYIFSVTPQIRKRQPRGLLSAIYPTTSSLPQFGF